MRKGNEKCSGVSINHLDTHMSYNIYVHEYVFFCSRYCFVINYITKVFCAKINKYLHVQLISIYTI